MMKLNFQVLILILVFLISCDYEANIEYQVENKTGGNITVVFESTSGIGVLGSITVPQNSIKTLVIQGKGINSVDDYKEDLEFLKEFSKMDIFKNDTLKSKTNFLRSENWKYIEHNAHQATEKCVVEESDF